LTTLPTPYVTYTTGMPQLKIVCVCVCAFETLVNAE